MGTDFLKCIVDLIGNDLGKCKPLTLVIDGVIVSICDKIIQPIVSYILLNVKFVDVKISNVL